MQVEHNRKRDLYIWGRGRLRVRDLTWSFFASSQNVDFPQSFILPFYTRKLALLSLVKEVTRSPDRKMIKLLKFDISFRHHDIRAETRSRMTKATTRFPAKVTLAHVRTLLSIEKISYS